MPGSGDQSSPAPELGAYRLGETLSEGLITRTYLARQVSVDRVVVLERIKEGVDLDPALVKGFLADVRAKAAVDHPGIGSVYEAVHEDEVVYYTREYLAGDSFETLHEEGRTFLPAMIASFLGQLASAMDYFRQRGIATLPLEPRHLVLSDNEALRLANLAVAEAEPVAEGHDRFLAAELFLDLLERGVPGATRTRKLLGMMISEEGTGLSWSQIEYNARKLAGKLSEAGKFHTPPYRPPAEHVPPSGNPKPAAFIILLGLLAALVGVGAFLVFGGNERPQARKLDTMVEVPGGSYANPEGKEAKLAQFWIDAHEVTIAEYAEFLDVLSALPPDKRRAYDHEDQPAIKQDHIPEEWESMLTAARTGSSWNGLALDPNCPVTRIDWWDAHAYANWRGGRLPTHDEWFAVVGESAAFAGAGWGPVDQEADDRTALGVQGLGGNVAEWIESPEQNPAFPMNPKSHLSCGGSFLSSGSNAGTRTWLPSREVRRPDLGFRVVREAAP